MPVKWALRERLKERGITRASQVSTIVRERTGYVLSTQAVCDLFNDQPKMLRLETSQALCDAFYCRLSDFLEVMPRAVSRLHSKKSRPRGSGSSGTDPMHGTQNDVTDTTRKDEKSSREHSEVDFASFFPDARKFSAEFSKQKSTVQQR